MKDNKHPHHDLIVEWAKDTSKVVQQYFPRAPIWTDDIDPTWDIEREYRFKPREFTKGHWYPCVDSNGEHSVCMFTGNGFTIDGAYETFVDMENEMKWIGESLGEINFG